MRNILLGILLCMVCVKTYSIEQTIEKEWEIFKLKYGKAYSGPKEELFRKSYFAKNFNTIKHHNELYEQGKETYSMAINKFADMSEGEKSRYQGYRPSEQFKMSTKTSLTRNAGVVIPDNIDWRSRGAVTDVKNSGSACNGGWAFSAAGALESQYFQKTRKLVNLSVQNLLDCCNQGKYDGCNGGDPIDAFAYIFYNDGIDSEKSYPYAGKQQECDYSPDNNVTSIKFFVDVGSGSEKYLKEAVALVGPVTANIYVDDTFYLYESGVYYNKYCKTTNLSHSVLVVGYGTTTDKPPLDYWLVKNSWGTTWGEQGYIKMARGKKNNCGIASQTTFPILY